jgi:hypothetical protein
VGDVGERVDLRLQLIDPAQTGLGQLARAELAATDQLGQFQRRASLHR